MRGFLKIAAGVCLAGGVATVASATSVSANLDVKATVSAACTISTAIVQFGTYAGNQVDANGTVTANCVNGTTYTIGLGAGNGAGATTSSRKMTSGNNTLAYALYSDSGHTTNWGNTVGTDTVPGTGTGGNQAYTVYGRIVANLSPAAGSYADVVQATVNF
jgi:spore coat protein U-like protein